MRELVSYFVDCVRKDEPPAMVKLDALHVALPLLKSSEEQRDISLT
jgi:hypothetical protein